jgi:hypothetical protein
VWFSIYCTKLRLRRRLARSLVSRCESKSVIRRGFVCEFAIACELRTIEHPTTTHKLPATNIRVLVSNDACNLVDEDSLMAGCGCKFPIGIRRFKVHRTHESACAASGSLGRLIIKEEKLANAYEKNCTLAVPESSCRDVVLPPCNVRSVSRS